jgi:hypothetical protein
MTTMPVTHRGQFRNVRSNTPTRYEMIAERGTERYVIGYYARRTRRSVWAAAFDSRIRMLDGLDEAPVDVSGKGARTAIAFNGWTVRFSGRTERSAIAEGELKAFT